MRKLVCRGSDHVRISHTRASYRLETLAIEFTDYTIINADQLVHFLALGIEEVYK